MEECVKYGNLIFELKENNMKAKLLKITELLKAQKAYNNIPYVLGMLETMVMDLENTELKPLMYVDKPSKTFFSK